MLIQISSIFHSFYNRCEIVIRQDHRSCILGNLTSGHSHRNTDIGLFQCRCIIHAVTCHCYDIPLLLPCTDNSDLMFRRNPRIHRDPFYKILQLFVRHIFDYGSLAGLRFFF